MTRDFVFDEQHNVIGYRCRVERWNNDGPTGELSNEFCNKYYRSARGLRKHQRIADGLFKQLKFKEIEFLEESKSI